MEVNYASILCQMSNQARNERPQADYYEEWKARNPGNMPSLRDQDVQDREELEVSQGKALVKGWINDFVIQPSYFPNHTF